MHVQSLRNSKIERRSENFVSLHRPNVPKYKNGKASRKKTNGRESTVENWHFGRLIIGCFTFSTAAAYLSFSFSSFYFFFILINTRGFLLSQTYIYHVLLVYRLITVEKMSMHILAALNSVLLTMFSSTRRGRIVIMTYKKRY